MGQTLVSVAVRVLMLSWEFPPVVVGGLGRHVAALSRELARAGHDVRVVTRGDGVAPVDERVEGVRVHRAAADPIAIDFSTESLLAWSQAAEHALIRAALPVIKRWRPDVVHAHDWLVAQSGVTLARLTGAELVVTMHATEGGRHHRWLPKPLNLAIHSVERWLTHEAAAVITCSSAMQDEASELFEVGDDHLTVIPNGIDPSGWRAPARARAAVRERLAGDGPLVVYAGRLVHEKGVQTLLDAVRPLRERHPGLRVAIAGTGVYEKALHERARKLRIARTVEWLGFVPEDQLGALLGAADVAVVPSLYEPFGIVALEAAAAHTPLVLAETGGLRDLVANGVAAASFPARDATALADAVSKVLSDPSATKRAVARADRLIRRDYTWHAVAVHTAELYTRVTSGSVAP